MERGGGATGQGATLLVRHLPEALPQETLKRLFAHYGASDLRTCIAGRLKNCAFVDFADETLAARAQSQLHRLRFLGKTLTVERARPHAVESNAGEEDANKRKESKAPPPDEASLPPHFNYGAKPTSGSYGSEPIAAALGVDYPFPPHLEYAYPSPDGNILSNIVNALIAVPRFYTQVLHLMNKMNLPAPFRPALPAPPLPPVPGSTAQKRPADLSSDESELESSGEEDNAEPTTESKRRKRRRKEAILGPAAAVDASHEAAGVKTIVAAAKVLPSIKKKQPVIQIKIAPKAEEKLKPENENLEESKPEEVSEPRKVATREELEKGKLPSAEMAGHSVFKNYTPGNPSPVLYIKNLDKDVVSEDLCYVFGAFFSSLAEAQAEMSIKLMQEGRMKGQAFVRFPSLQIAGDALAGAHSFVLKGKPMVIQFGRNSAKS